MNRFKLASFLLVFTLSVLVSGCATAWDIAAPRIDDLTADAIALGIQEAEKEVGEEISQAFEDALVVKVQAKLKYYLKMLLGLER